MHVYVKHLLCWFCCDVLFAYKRQHVFPTLTGTWVCCIFLGHWWWSECEALHVGSSWFLDVLGKGDVVGKKWQGMFLIDIYFFLIYVYIHVLKHRNHWEALVPGLYATEPTFPGSKEIQKKNFITLDRNGKDLQLFGPQRSSVGTQWLQTSTQTEGNPYEAELMRMTQWTYQLQHTSSRMRWDAVAFRAVAVPLKAKP